MKLYDVAFEMVYRKCHKSLLSDKVLWIERCCNELVTFYLLPNQAIGWKRRSIPYFPANQSEDVLSANQLGSSQNQAWPGSRDSSRANQFSRACYQLPISRVCHQRHIFPRLQPNCFLHFLPDSKCLYELLRFQILPHITQPLYSQNFLPEIKINLSNNSVTLTKQG